MPTPSPAAASTPSTPTPPAPSPCRRAFIRDTWPILLPALALICLFPYLPSVRSPNELCRLRQTQALVEDSAIEISAALKRHGWVGAYLLPAAIAAGSNYYCMGSSF